MSNIFFVLTSCNRFSIFIFIICDLGGNFSKSNSKTPHFYNHVSAPLHLNGSAYKTEGLIWMFDYSFFPQSQIVECTISVFVLFDIKGHFSKLKVTMPHFCDKERGLNCERVVLRP